MKSLKQIYQNEIVKNLMKELGYSNKFMVPKIVKISISIGLGKAKEKPDIIGRVANDLYLISGQKPRICKSKKAISGFKVRQGDIIGLNLTLRGNRMYEFLQKLLNIALPRVRDFRGLSLSGFDMQNNYTIGLKEHIMFPEISYEKIEDIYGMQISINNNAKTKKEAMSLLKMMGFPFKKPLKGARNG